MPREQRKQWIDLCNAVVQAQDRDELFKLVQELSEALEHEEQSRNHARRTEVREEIQGGTRC